MKLTTDHQILSTGSPKGKLWVAVRLEELRFKGTGCLPEALSMERGLMLAQRV